VIKVLDLVHTMGLGAALALIFVNQTHGFDVSFEISVTSLIWAGAFFAKLALEKRSKVAVHG